MSKRYGRAWTLRRQGYADRMALGEVMVCPRCHLPINPAEPWDLGHTVPVSMGGTVADGVAPEHRRCNRSGGRVGLVPASDQDQQAAPGFSDSLSSARDSSPLDSLSFEPFKGLGPEESAWDRCGWLDQLRDVPDIAQWPRLMTGPHPNAVGSYGPELIMETRARTGGEPRWWQELVLTRLLEHDHFGNLVWLVLLLSTARQVGKSHLLGDLALWRIHQATRFGEEQLVMHTGKDLAVCREVQRPSRQWAKAQEWNGYVVANRYGQEEVASPDGSRWMVRAQDAVYGYGVGLGMVDEAWKVPAPVVDDGLEPTMAERIQPQLILTSTAHRRATSLYPTRRRAALAELDAPTDVLMIEWSAGPEAEVTDRRAWRQASPHWSSARERLLASKLDRALAGEGDKSDPDEPDPVESFRAQYLNTWPVAVPKRSRGREESLVERQAWADALALGEQPLDRVAAVEDWFGQGAAAAVAGVLPDGRISVAGQVFDTRAQAITWAGLQLPSRLRVGASLAGCPELTDWPLEIPWETAGSSDTRTALATFRELLATCRLVHQDHQAGGLSVQVTGALVVRNTTGLALSPRSPRSDLLRAAAWAIESAHRAPVLAVPQIW